MKEKIIDTFGQFDTKLFPHRFYDEILSKDSKILSNEVSQSSIIIHSKHEVDTKSNAQSLFSNSHYRIPNYFKSISVFYEEIISPMSERLEELSSKLLQDYENTLLVSAIGYYSKFEKLINDYLKYQKQNGYESYMVLVLTFLINKIKSLVHFAQRTKDIRRFHESSQEELIGIIEFIENYLSPEEEIKKFSYIINY